ALLAAHLGERPLAFRGFAPVAPRPGGVLSRRAEAARAAARAGLPLLAPDAPLAPVLDAGGLVVFALDAREGPLRPTSFLGRTALLPTEPWELAARRGVPVIAALCIRDRDRTHRLHLREPQTADMALPAEARPPDLQ